MSSTIFLREIDRSFHISVLVPSHKYSISIERKTLELALFVYLDRGFTAVERFPDIFSLFRDGDYSTIEEDEVLVSVSCEIFIFIDCEE